MVSVGDSEWLVPGDPRSQATFSSLAQCEVVCAWDEAEVHFIKGQVASGATQGHPRGGVGKCQEACLWIGGCSAMIANGIDETSLVTSLKDSLAKAKRNAQEPSSSIQLKGAMEFVERALGSVWLPTTPNVQCWRRSWSTAKPGCIWRQKFLWRPPQGLQSWMPRSLS